jgi:anti-sigma B factor antagonist
MTLALASRIVSGVVIIDVSGRLCFCERSLSEQTAALLKEKYRRFVINLAETTHMDAFGLGQLIKVWTLVGNTGGSVSLMRPSVQVLRLLEITKLNTLFQVIQEEADILEYDYSCLAASA